MRQWSHKLRGTSLFKNNVRTGNARPIGKRSVKCNHFKKVTEDYQDDEISFQTSKLWLRQRYLSYVVFSTGSCPVIHSQTSSSFFLHRLSKASESLTYCSFKSATLASISFWIMVFLSRTSPVSLFQ
jgi:hypothetical protein